MTQRMPRMLSIAIVLSLILQLIALSAPASVALAEPITTNNPPIAPHSIEVFPSRDFVSVSGYADTETLTIEVIHSALYGGGIVTTASGLVPDGGVVEVNHPGGYCWVGVTPDIRPGDVVRVTVDQTNIADATTVAGVTARRPVQTGPNTIQVTGIAVDANGNPLPIGEIEQRLISPGNLFDFNDRRSLRADGTGNLDGVLAYDLVNNPDGTKWTATYDNLSLDDVNRALAAESRILWLGTDPLAAVEATLFEIGAGVIGGPAAPCTAPLEVLPPPPGSELIPPTDPSGLTASVSNSNTVTLSWTGSTDNVGVTAYGIYRNGVVIANVQNPDGSPNPPTTYADMNVPPGTYTYTVDAADEIGNRSGQSNAVTAATVTQPAPGGAFNDPPINGRAFGAFPSRDFVSLEGYLADELVNVMVIRNGLVISTASGVIPIDLEDTPAFDGIVEVNHPGGVCWEGVTPELRAGDIIRGIAYGPGAVVRSVDQIVVSNVTANKAIESPLGSGTVIITGTAQDADGNPIPIDQLEQRLVSSSADPFEVNGRRTLRADSAGVGEGLLSYDTVDNPTGTKWTATYTGLSAFDVQRAIDVESRIMWLGRDPLAGIELTLFEVGLLDPPGPSPAFCTTPLEAADVTAPSAPALTAVPNGAAKEVQLNWSTATDDTAIYGHLITRDGQPLRYVGAATRSYLDANVSPGPHTYTVQAFDSASPRGAGPSIIEQLTAGLGQRYGNLSNASNTISVTMPDVTAPSVPANLVAVSGLGQVDLTWSASTDDVGVVEYGVYRDSVLITTTTGTAFSDLGLAIGSYSYSVDAADAVGNRSALAPAVVANVTAAPDVTAPSIPTDVAASVPDLRARNVVITWSASTDDVGVTSYTIYRDGVAVATVNGTTLTYTDVNIPAETYSYTVAAADSAGNRSAQSDASTAAVANDPPSPPHGIEVFPSRDFVSTAGYDDLEGPVTFSVYRNGALVSTSDQITPAGGIAEVNHTGGGCWVTVTPDIRPGDLVRVTNADGVSDQTIVAGVMARVAMQTAPGTIVVRGVAMDEFGAPLPIGQLEQRLVSDAGAFNLGGAQTLRADASGALEGTLSYDAPGSVNWTATYTGLNGDDVALALAAESRAVWLGRNPLGGNELTLFENGPGIIGGPEAGFCTAPAEGNVPSAGLDRVSVAFANQAAFPAPTTSGPQVVRLTNVGTAPLSITAVYIAGAHPSEFTLTGTTCGATLAAGTSCTATVTFRPTAVGLRSASLSFLDNAANTSYQTVPLTGTGTDVSAPNAPGAPVAGITPAISAVSGLNIPGTVTWVASTSPALNPSGTATLSYELEQSTNNGVSYTPVTLASSTATSYSAFVPAGSYRFRARACYTVNCSPWSVGVNITLATAQENNAAISYSGTWATQVVAGSFGGSVRHASTNRDKATYKVTATRIAWVTTRGPDRGRVTVSIDGGAAISIDLYAPTQQPGQVVFVSGSLAAGRSHQIVVQVLGNRNALSTGNRADIDGFITLR